MSAKTLSSSVRTSAVATTLLPKVELLPRSEEPQVFLNGPMPLFKKIIIFGYCALISGPGICYLAYVAIRRFFRFPIGDRGIRRSFDPTSFLVTKIWNAFPASWKLPLSRLSEALYQTEWSKRFIKPYVWLCYDDDDYLQRFVPASRAESYLSFQDFFTRDYKTLPDFDKKGPIWPCQGLLCDVGRVSEFKTVSVKGDKKEIRSIFGRFGLEIPDGYHFANIFLHNMDYHHIHSPVTGVIRGVERLQGDLLVLRPWFYTSFPSIPAMVNERVNLKIEDEEGRLWFLSVVGGPCVNTVLLPDGIGTNSRVRTGQKIATFRLGSTCCIAGPVGTEASAGDPIDIFTRF